MKRAAPGFALLLAALTGLLLPARGQDRPPPGPGRGPGPWHAMFWNVENFFDTVDDPETENRDSLDRADYDEKLRRVREVVRRVDFGRGPDILGLVEVENAEVVRQIVGPGYQVHLRPCVYERGINVALATRLPVAAGTAVSHLDPGTTGRTMLHAVLQAGPERLHVFVLHLKSKRNPARTAEHAAGDEVARSAEARFLWSKVKEILAAEPRANVLLLGDYNEGHRDSLFRDELPSLEFRRGDPAPSLSDEDRRLVNYGAALQQSFPQGGTCYYHPNWDIFDNVLASEALADEKGLWLSPHDVWIGVSWDLLNNYAEPKRFDGKYPTCASDHLPVVMRLRIGD